MKNSWREQARRQVKDLHLRSRDLVYRCLTKHRQFGSPSGHAPRQFTDQLLAYATANPKSATWTPVMPAELLHQPAPNGSPFLKEHFQPYLEHRLPAEGVMQLTNARILGGYAGAVATADNTLLTPFSTDPFGFGRHRSSARLRLPTIKKISGRTAFLATPEADRNYYHFTVDLLPRLLLLEKALGSLEQLDHLVLNLGDKGYEAPLLRRFGVPLEKIIRLSDGAHLLAQELLVPTWTPSEYGVAKWKTDGIRAKVLSGESFKTPDKRLFLSRKNAAFRRLLNEDELLAGLQQLGFESIDCGTLTLDQQATFFSSATHVVGLHGAAFSNVVYCRPETQIYEIINESAPKGFFWSLSAARSLKHNFISTQFAQSTDKLENHRANMMDISADASKLVAKISFEIKGVNHDY